ncbi:Chaperone protein dnaJ 6 [Cryptosporidium felis]|nr:Chaperone protein dnaJ 6 [Cryptosporidium felis]
MVRDNRLYTILGISPNASIGEIKREYRIRALALHPDKNPNDETSKERFQELQRAYEILRNEESRKLYDETGIIEGGESENHKFDEIIKYFKQFTRKISERDVEEYKKQYRGSEDEWEDVSHFYLRFNGNCKLLLEYIPFSEPENIEYYVNMIEKAISDGKLPKMREFEGSIGELYSQGKKWKARIKREKARYKDENGNIDDLVLAIKNNSKKRLATFGSMASKFSGESFEDFDEKKFKEIQENLVKNKRRK